MAMMAGSSAIVLTQYVTVKPGVIDQDAGQRRVPQENWSAVIMAVDRHRVHHKRRRHQTRDQCGARRPIEDVDESTEKPERINMPDLHSAGMGQNDHGYARHQLDDHRRQQYLLSVESIGDSAGEQAENDEGQCLQKSRQPQLEG